MRKNITHFTELITPKHVSLFYFVVFEKKKPRLKTKRLNVYERVFRFLDRHRTIITKDRNVLKIE